MLRSRGSTLRCRGAFKFRGACNAVFSLSEVEAGRGIVTHSSGNHAGALALAASLRGISAHIVVPEDTPQVWCRSTRAIQVFIKYCCHTSLSVGTSANLCQYTLQGSLTSWSSQVCRTRFALPQKNVKRTWSCKLDWLAITDILVLELQDSYAEREDIIESRPCRSSVLVLENFWFTPSKPLILEHGGYHEQ